MTQRLHAFLSPRRANVTQCNGRIIYLNGQRLSKVLAQRSNLTPQRAKNIANQRANTAMGEKYCEWAAKHIKISCLPREY